MEKLWRNHPGRAIFSSLNRTDIVRLALNAALLGCWLWLYFPVLAYLAILFTREEFRTNQVVLVLVAALAVYQLRKTKVVLKPGAPPQLYPPALALALISSVLYLLAERFLDINTLSAVLFGLGSYGLLGLWIRPQQWKAGFPIMLLVVGILPFGEHIETFIGYPVRILSAQIISAGLHALGIPSLSLDTILVFENSISQVDIPCSGVKSLWTGMLFFLAATWIENRLLNLRWLFSAGVFSLMLLAANLARVAILVVAGQVIGWQLAAEMIHVPLGVVGFVICCAAGLWLLRRQPLRPPLNPQPEISRRQPAWLSPAVLAVTILFALLYTARPSAASSAVFVEWQFPAVLNAQGDPLSAQEQNWITQDGAEWADRRRFTWKNLSGSLMLLTSWTWRGQHKPERCFEVYGLSTQESATILAAPDFPIKSLILNSPGSQQPITAAYWFQSAQQTTDDYGTRIWADLSTQRQRWVLVTLLLDAGQAFENDQLNELYTTIHTSVSFDLTQGGKP